MGECPRVGERGADPRVREVRGPEWGKGSIPQSEGSKGYRVGRGEWTPE